MKTRKTKAFTLVELLVVLAIIALLSTLGASAVFHYRKRARDSKIEMSLSQVRVLAADIYNDKSSYADLCSGATLNSEGYPSTLGVIKSEVNKFSGANPLCRAATNAYCVSSVLNVGGKYCVDSAGYAGSTKPTCDESFVCH